MKTIVKLMMSVAIVAGLATATLSCKKDQKTTGHMTVKMTDAPAEYVAVNVEVIGVNVHVDGQGWINLPIKPGIYNLLELQNDVTVVLADNIEMPVGKVSQVRLVLGSQNSITTAEGTFELKVPSGEESGLKINVHEEIAPNKLLIMVLDFDANASVVVTGNGSFSLKPVIKVKSAIQV